MVDTINSEKSPLIMVRLRFNISHCNFVGFLKRDISPGKHSARGKSHTKKISFLPQTDCIRSLHNVKRVVTVERPTSKSVEKFSIRYYSENMLLKENRDDWGGPEAQKLILHLQDNFLDVIKTYQSLLVFFYTSWCKHCKKLKSVYGAAAIKMEEENIPGRLAALDLTKRMDVADKYNIVSVPIMNYFRNGEFIKVYDGKRTMEDIVKFMKDPPTKPPTLSNVDI